MRDRYKNAARAYAVKVKQEDTLAPKVHAHLKDVSKHAFDHYSKYGTLPSMGFHQQHMEGLIKEHYKNTAELFSNSLRKRMGEPKNNNNLNKSIFDVIKSKSQQRAHDSSVQITDTTLRQLHRSINLASSDLAIEEGRLENDTIATAAKEIFENYILGRTSTISTTETQTAAESGKDIEYNVLSNADAQFDDDSRMSDYKATKMWVAVLDDHTRDWHAEADGQEVSVDEPYVVNDEELMYPGDDSLDASDENLINCRCSSEIVMV